MATSYIYGTILTASAVAANNRGDNVGNTTTLQKVFHNDDVHTSVSAEAIRFALRYRFQLEKLKVNRTYDSSTGRLSYEDEKRTTWGSDFPFSDDDIMGFMDAAAAKQESEDEDIESSEETEPQSKNTKARKKAKGTTTKRQSPLSVGRAISLRPYRGEISFNCVSGEKEKGRLSLYAAEMHTTEYQYSFGLNLSDVVDKKNIAYLLDAIIDPPTVAGNHSRFLYDFSPASIVLRVSNEHSSRIQNCFDHDDENRTFSVKRLVSRIKSGDVPANEIIVGGDLANTDDGKMLAELGVKVVSGTKAAMAEARRRIAKLDSSLSVVAEKLGAAI